MKRLFLLPILCLMPGAANAETIWLLLSRAEAGFEKIEMRDMQQCKENGAALQKLYREIKFKCISGLAEGSGTPISPEELMSRYGFKDSSY